MNRSRIRAAIVRAALWGLKKSPSAWPAGSPVTEGRAVAESWNPDAYFWLAFARRHSGLIRATAHGLMTRSLLAGLRGLNPSGERPGSWRIAAAPGGLGRYEARKADLQSADRSPARYARGCRRAAKRAGV